MSLWDDAQADRIADALAAPATPPAKPEAWHNFSTFVDGGYLARIVRQTCLSCSAITEQSQGIFHAEVKIGATDRRLTRLPPGGQWPMNEALPLEVEESTTDYCADCLRILGFNVERQAQLGFVHGH